MASDSGDVVYDPTDELSEGSFEQANAVLGDPSQWGKDTIFNPPLMRSKRQAWLKGYSRDKWNESASLGRAKTVNAPGFIVADPVVLRAIKGTGEEGTSWNPRVSNYGFRFHFNPPNLVEAYSRPMDVNYLKYIKAISMADKPMISPKTGSYSQIELLLARRDDVARLRGWEDWPVAKREEVARNFYGIGNATVEQVNEIYTKGTGSDIEYLFRVLNGDPFDTWHGESSNFGMLMPTMVNVFVGDSLGARKMRGVINSVSWVHQQFAAGMVPVYTQLQISFTRMPDSYFQDGKDASGNLGKSAMTGFKSGTVKAGTGVNTGDPTAPATSSGGWTVPAVSYTLTPGNQFGTNRGTYIHEGMDLGAGNGTPPVFAAREGTVMNAYSTCVEGNDACNGGAGNWVVISHGTVPPYAAELRTVYMHLSRVDVQAGARVKGGQQIGLIGNTGYSRGNHLHFGLQIGGTYVDPQTVFHIPGSG